MILEIKKLIEQYIALNEGPFVQTNIEEYISKLSEKAVIFTFHENKQTAFIAFYANNTVNKVAYLSMLIVERELRGRGLGYMLYMQSENYLKQRGFKVYQLEVLNNNKNALKFYSRLGFYEVSRSPRFNKMQKDL